VPWWGRAAAEPPGEGEDEGEGDRELDEFVVQGDRDRKVGHALITSDQAGCNDPRSGSDVMGMNDIKRAAQELAAARAYPEQVRAAKVAEYRVMLNVAVVLAVLAILVAVASLLV
jgi:hypothetical protein